MPFKDGDFQYTRDEAYANVTTGKYGEEHDDAMAELVNVENGVRKHWADRLREFVNAAYSEDNSTALALRSVMLEVVSRLDPYSGDDGANGEYARSEYTGDGWLKP